MGYRSDSIAISRDMGPLRFWRMFLDPTTGTRVQKPTFLDPQKTERGCQKTERRYKKRNEGTFAKTAFLQNWPFPKGPNLEKIQDLEIFKRDWNFQASHPPTPYFLWGILKVEIENFKRDWNFQARLNFFKIWALRVCSLSRKDRKQLRSAHANENQRLCRYGAQFVPVCLSPYITRDFPESEDWVTNFCAYCELQCEECGGSPLQTPNFQSSWCMKVTKNRAKSASLFLAYFGVCMFLLSCRESRFSQPPPPTPEFLTKHFCLQPGLGWKFLLRRAWSGQKLPPLQFPRLSLP